MTEKDIRTEARVILSATRVLRKGPKSERISLFGAILLTQAEKALQGNDRAAKVVLEVGLHCGMFDRRQKDPSVDLTKLEDDEVPILERMLAKMHAGIPEQEEV
ncbi:hypothetical protein LPJ38_34000 [Bradyrhizobium daqingense]|uniref:Uncharacterized protein n=1 Tax=Bradyrhizobium daqingense TaxID=993502 RepID=A0A562KZP5_9BRAD|nr:hypothetical protein [Bradyrhizobium daqingense]TWI00852.1 hypothetical protein IQ17_04855 [Bradyrhizobium daqingense]UFS88588.1 hypothetical protein LPJ38_34000 [Bradyrhizobium daqingense]